MNRRDQRVSSGTPDEQSDVQYGEIKESHREFFDVQSSEIKESHQELSEVRKPDVLLFYIRIAFYILCLKMVENRVKMEVLLPIFGLHF